MTLAKSVSGRAAAARIIETAGPTRCAELSSIHSVYLLTGCRRRRDMPWHIHRAIGFDAAALDHDRRCAGNFLAGDDNLTDHERMRRAAKNIIAGLIERYTCALAVVEQADVPATRIGTRRV